MANPKHLKILEQGVEEWNQWRKDNPEIKPDLIGAKLSGGDLIGAKLSKVGDLSRADLRGALNLSWQSVSQSIVDDETKLPNEIESQHKDELRAMREQTKRARADRNLTEEQ